MEKPNKEGQRLPMLTPKNPDGPQRVIKQIMVIDPNKLRVAGLDLKMAEALKKSKGRSTSSSPVVRSKEDKLALAKSMLNKKLKQAQISKESAKSTTASAKSVEEAVRRLTFSNVTKTPAAPRPQIKVADLKSLMPPPASPVAPPANKSQTLLLNFLKRDQQTGSIEVNFVNLSTGPQIKIEADDIPKASIRSTGIRKRYEPPRTIESKVISSEVKFEIKKRPQLKVNEMVSIPQNRLPTTVEYKLLQPSRKEKARVKFKSPPPQNHLPEVIESKVLSPEEQIDLSTLCVKAPAKIVPATVPLAISKQRIGQQGAVLNLSKEDEVNAKKKPGEAVVRTYIPPKSVVQESAVDFINSMFEAKSRNESKPVVVPKMVPKTVPKTGTKLTGEDATSFLMALFGKQSIITSNNAAVSSTLKSTEVKVAHLPTAKLPKSDNITVVVGGPSETLVTISEKLATTGTLTGLGKALASPTNESSFSCQEKVADIGVVSVSTGASKNRASRVNESPSSCQEKMPGTSVISASTGSAKTLANESAFLCQEKTAETGISVDLVHNASEKLDIIGASKGSAKNRVSLMNESLSSCQEKTTETDIITGLAHNENDKLAIIIDRASLTKEKLTIINLPTESTKIRASLTNESPPPCQVKMPETGVTAVLAQNVNEISSHENITRLQKASQQSILSTSDSSKEPPCTDIENVTLQEQVSVSSESSVVRKSIDVTSNSSTSPIESSSTLKKDDKDVQGSIDHKSKEAKEPQGESNLKGDTALGEKEPPIECNLIKIDQKDSTNKTTTTAPDKTKEILKESEPKVENASTSTVSTRRKGKKSVPVLIAKLNRNRKPPASQEKRLEKVEQVVKVSNESEKSSTEGKSLKKAEDISTVSLTPSHESPFIPPEIHAEEVVTSEQKTESMKKPTVACTSEKKNPDESMSNQVVDQENPPGTGSSSQDVVDNKKELVAGCSEELQKSTTPKPTQNLESTTQITTSEEGNINKNAAELRGETKEHEEKSEPQSTESKEEKSEMTTRQSTTPKPSQKLVITTKSTTVPETNIKKSEDGSQEEDKPSQPETTEVQIPCSENIEKTIDASHPSIGDATRSQDEETDTETTTISNAKTEELRQVESKVEIPETPTKSKGKNRHSTAPKAGPKPLNISESQSQDTETEPLTTTIARENKEKLKQVESKIETAETTEIRSQDEEIKPQMTTIAKANKEVLREVESKVEIPEGNIRRSTSPKVHHKPTESSQSTVEDRNINIIESQSLETQELPQIQNQDNKTSKNTRGSRSKSMSTISKTATNPDQGKTIENTTDVYVSEAVSKYSPKSRVRRSKGSRISEKSAGSELDSDIELKNASISKTPSEKLTTSAAPDANSDLVLSPDKTHRSTKKKKADEVYATETISIDVSTCIDIHSLSSKIADEKTPPLLMPDEKTLTSNQGQTTNEKTEGEGPVAEIVAFEAETSKEKLDLVSTTSKAHISKQNEMTEVISADLSSAIKEDSKIPETSEWLQGVSDTEITEPISDAGFSEVKSSRSRKKTAKFEEYSRSSVKTLNKTLTKDPESTEGVQPLISVFDSLITSQVSFAESPQTPSSGKQSKRTPRFAKATINLVDRKKGINTEETSIEIKSTKSSEPLEDTDVFEDIMSPSFRNCDSSDDSDGFECCDSTIDENTKKDTDNPEVSINPSITTPVEKPPDQGETKNPFRKAKPVEKEETNDDDVNNKASPNDEIDFFGFNEKEIEEGHHSTSLRLSQSEEVIPLQLPSPSGSSEKKKSSPRVKKVPLSGGKKQKTEQQNWTKKASASMKNWLAAPDTTKKEFGDGKAVCGSVLLSQQHETNEMNLSIPPKKRRGKAHNSIESINIEEGVKPLQKDLKTTSKSVEEKSPKLGVEEGAPVSGVIQEQIIPIPGKGGKMKRKTASFGKDSTDKDDTKSPLDYLKITSKSVRKGAKPGPKKRSPELDVTPAKEQIIESPGKIKKTKGKKASEGRDDLNQDAPDISECKIPTVDDLKASKKAQNRKRKAPSVEKDTPKTVDDGKSTNESSPGTSESKKSSKASSKPEKTKPKKTLVDKNAPDIVNDVNLLQEPVESKKSTKTPCKPEKKKPKKSADNKNAHDIEDNVKPLPESIDDLKTPSKSDSRKRKRPTVRENTPNNEPPIKIPHLTPNNDPLLTPSAVRRRGRPLKSEARISRRRKLPYVPVVPVSPLERKFKNDTEFNPRLLLIRQKEEFKTDAPIIDPDLQTTPMNKDDVQCALCMGYTAKKKWLQHVSGHYGIGWIVGTPPPLNVKSRASVLNYMVDFFKLSKVKGLNCRLCQGQRRSALGLLVHLEQCWMTEDELKESRVECEHCKANYSRTSIVIHLRSCPELLKKSKLEVVQEPKATDGVNEEDVLSNTGRLKRQSVIKAENKFKNLGDNEFIPDELIKHIPQQRTDNHSSIWLREIQSFGKGFCIQKKCPFTATTVEELLQHCQESVCPFTLKPGYLCTKCKFHANKIEPVREHVIQQHKPRSLRDFEDSGDEAVFGSESSSESVSSGDEESGDDDDGNEDVHAERKVKRRKRVKNVSRRRLQPQKSTPTKDFKKLLPDRTYNIASYVANWYESFIRKNYSKDPLFAFATPSTTQSDDDGYEAYFSKSPLSMKFILNGFIGFVKKFGKTNVQPDQWQLLERSKGAGASHEHIMYLGGPVKSIAWVPLEPHPPSSIQYLATVTRKEIDKFTRFVQPRLSRSLVYIQKYHINESKEIRGEIYYAFPIDRGPIHCIEFLPSGGYAPEMNRLSLLAISTVETVIKIYSLPLEVEKRNCDIFPIVRLEPCFELCLELTENLNEYSKEYQSQCVHMVWSQSAGHNFIIGGYLNGYVAIWDISDEDDNLNRFLVNGRKKFVPISYFWTMDNRIKEVAAHYDINGLRWLAVCNSTRKLLIYDLREISNPVLFYMDTTKNVCNSMDWPVVWENPSYGLGDAMPSHGCCINTVSPMSLIFVNRRFDKFCCGVNDIHFNTWRNVYAAGADNGDIHVTTLREAVLDVGHRMKNDEKTISTLDIVPLDGEEIITKTSQKPPDGQRLFEKDYTDKYGLVFGTTERIMASKKRELYGADRKPPINLRRLMRVNRLRFNPNRNVNALLAVGYDNGLLRVLQSNWHRTLKDTSL